jgi:hypothetical protein
VEHFKCLHDAHLLDIDNEGYCINDHGITTRMSGQTNAFAAMFPTSRFVREFRPDQEGIHQSGLRNSQEQRQFILAIIVLLHSWSCQIK